LFLRPQINHSTTLKNSALIFIAILFFLKNTFLTNLFYYLHSIANFNEVNLTYSSDYSYLTFVIIKLAIINTESANYFIIIVILILIIIAIL
jgi:hypothetical protein